MLLLRDSFVFHWKLDSSLILRVFCLFGLFFVLDLRFFWWNRVYVNTDPCWFQFIISFPLPHSNIERVGGYSVGFFACFYSSIRRACLTIKAFSRRSICQPVFQVSIPCFTMFLVMMPKIPWPKRIHFALELTCSLTSSWNFSLIAQPRDREDMQDDYPVGFECVSSLQFPRLPLHVCTCLLIYLYLLQDLCRFDHCTEINLFWKCPFFHI